jgi:hypothetical protein
MRPLAILGVILLIVGGLILSGRLSRKSSETLLEVGGVKAEVEDSKAFPQWTGILALVAGVGLIAAGARKKA